MGFFSNLRADRIITDVRGSADPNSPPTRKAVARLIDIGDDAVYPILGALPDASKEATAAFTEALSGILGQKNFQTFVQAMVEGSPRVVAGLKWAMTNSRAYPPHLLLDVLSKPDVPKSAILDVIVAQKDRFSVRELLTAAHNQQPNEKAALFRVISDIATPAAVLSANGAAHTSPGQRPGYAPSFHQALKGRHNRCFAPTGLGIFLTIEPRALPWAGISRPFGAAEGGAK